MDNNNNNRPVPHVAEANLLRYMPVAQAGYHSEGFATNTRNYFSGCSLGSSKAPDSPTVGPKSLDWFK